MLFSRLLTNFVKKKLKIEFNIWTCSHTDNRILQLIAEQIQKEAIKIVDL